MAPTTITADEVRRLLDYDPETGVFTRLAGKRAGKTTGSRVRAGYVFIYLAGRTYKAHRLAWLYVYGSWPKALIDHINHDRADNRIVNLRDATHTENHHNRKRLTRGTTGFLGVTWHKRDRRWQSHMELERKALHLGSFVCLGRAIKARLAAEKTHHPSRPR